MLRSDIHILAVDDDQNNLLMIEAFLDEGGYDNFTLKEGGQECLDYLENNTPDIILLDRMMPEIDGMEVLRQLKADTRTKDIPVIMQTAAAEKDQILEGLKAGIYYYLTKPYDEENLLSIVNAAAEDVTRFKELTKGSELFEQLNQHVHSMDMEISQIGQVTHVARFLATFFPEPETAVVGVSELLMNAIEHGNLGINYNEKSDLIRAAGLTEEVVRRQALPENIHKRVRIHIARNDTAVELRIEDEGHGFDWKRYLEFDTSRVTDPNGRGIAIANSTAFDELQYLGAGNKVIARSVANGSDE